MSEDKEIECEHIWADRFPFNTMYDAKPQICVKCAKQRIKNLRKPDVEDEKPEEK